LAQLLTFTIFKTKSICGEVGNVEQGCVCMQCMLMAAFALTSCRTDGVQLMMSLLFLLPSRSGLIYIDSCLAQFISDKSFTLLCFFVFTLHMLQIEVTFS